MRTDSQKKLKLEISPPDLSSDSKETMKIARKSLHPLQVAAGDKENLVGAGRMPTSIPEKDAKTMKHTNSTVSPKKDKNKSQKKVDKVPISVEDLTSEEGPSEHYWEVLAETRFKALEKTLKENQRLHEENQQLREKYKKLSEENMKYKELLEEAQAIIDTLNEVIVEMDNEDDSSNGEELIRTA